MEVAREAFPEGRSCDARCDRHGSVRVDAKKDLLAQLLALNGTVAAREKAGQPVTALEIPPS